ncbi:acylphosphatase [Coniochaeta sp. 2T2.1]|nr:acylphosphatase [Coniochaeta sp. 2T2.1]
MSSHKRVYFLAHGGMVQGVGFRYFTQKRAAEYKLTGWVEGEAQGDHEAILSFLKDVDQGPRHSHVVRLDQEDREVVEGETEFRVRH